MASKGTKGKSTDRSTAWSEYVWDERGYWTSSRLNPYGKTEYQYRLPEANQSSEEQPNIPRSPGPNVLTTDYAPVSTTTDILYETYAPESSSSYTTSYDPVSPYATATQHDPNAYPNASGTPPGTNEYASSDTESVATVRNATTNRYQAYSTNLSYSSVPQVHQATVATEDARQAFSDLAIAGPSTQAIPPSLGLENIPNITPNRENYGKLDPRYKVVNEKKQKHFWKVGRVFMLLWIEPAGQMSPSAEGFPSTRGSQLSQFSTTYLEGTAFSEIRRFVVVGAGYGNSICSPIHTYGGQATLKYNLPEPSQHAIIYTSSSPPEENQYDTPDGVVKENLTRDPIKVLREQNGPEGDLGTRSRINYSKVYTVENYVRVLNIGMVTTESMGSLIRNAFVKPRETPIEKPRNHPRRTRSHTDDKKGKVKGKEKEGERRRR